MKTLPVALQLANRRVLVVGGGRVAARKVAALLEAGALVTVVSPDLAPDFPSPAEHLARPFGAGDCAGFWLVFAATNRREVNAQIAQEARALNIPVNDASAPEDSDFHTQAVVRRGPVVIGISTQGVSPVVSAHLKRQIEEVLGEEWGLLLSLVEEEGEPPKDERGAFWRAILQSEVLGLLREGKTGEARLAIRNSL